MGTAKAPSPHYDDKNGYQRHPRDSAHPPSEDAPGTFLFPGSPGLRVRAGSPRTQPLPHEPHEGREHRQGDDDGQGPHQWLRRYPMTARKGILAMDRPMRAMTTVAPGKDHRRTRGRDGSGSRFLHLGTVTQLVTVGATG